MSTAEDVLHLVEARARALAEQDAEGLRLLMHPECVWTSYAGLVLDRDEYVRRNTTAVRFASQRFEGPVVRVGATRPSSLGRLSTLCATVNSSAC
ncbi:nuclear transport factor 2 family protein [Luteococcus sp. H138]|uniref:nuclear transport factor 2 family protein n=1 Tax=unclassified Luteococcus TaxID=2639923 RepID=UPI00313A8184